MSLRDAPGPALSRLPRLPLPAVTADTDGSTPYLGLGPRLLRAGCEALDDRELLQLLLSPFHSNADARALADTLLSTFGSPARVLAARTGALHAVEGLCEDAVCAIKAAEALGIRLARARVPDRIDPAFVNYHKVIDYCRALVGHRPVEELLLLFLNSRNRLIAEERHQHGTIDHTPAYPREICIRALETNASALILVHQHPGGDPTPSSADIDMTQRIRDALKTIDVALHDHIVVTPGAAVSFKEKGLL